MKTIEIDGEQVQISTQPGRARKTVDMEFKPREIIIRIPRDHQVDVDELLEKRRALIERKYREAISKIHIYDGERVLLKGRPHDIKTRVIQDSSESRINLDGDELIIYHLKEENPHSILKKWMTKQTRNLIDEVAEKYSREIIGAPIRISVTDTKRWGYCRKNGAIVYNWQLMALPPEIAEFVVLHELVHLSHLNHQRGFHKKMASLIPDYKERENKLRGYLAIGLNFEYKTMKM